MRKLLCVLALSVLPFVGWAQGDHNLQVAKNLEIFNSIYKNLDLMYVDTLNANEVVGNGIRAMLGSLDPYTEYYDEADVKKLRTMLTGTYTGIGALIRYNFALQRVVIDEPYANTPAAEAGLKKGDIILSIDDSTMTDKNNDYVSSHLRGEAGTTFLLKIKRPSTGKILKMKITRRAIQMPAVPYYGMRPGKIGYINLSKFTEGCAKQVRRALVELKKDGAKGLVLDLRNNGGGSLDEAISIVNMFVPKGITLVEQKGKLKRANNTYKSTVEPVDSVLPLVVLVNGNTASASEITGGCMQDLDRGVVLGTRTYGKGLVQTTMELPYNTQMKLTTSYYYIPSGRCIQAIKYRHSNGGSSEQVADSLKRLYHTVGGREVRGGGGIKPDVEVAPDSLPNIAFYMFGGMADSSEVALNYEVNYIAKHPTIAPADEFELTDNDYADFKAQVLGSKFKYDRMSDKYLDDIEKVAKFEGYYNDAKPEFEALKKKLRHNTAKDLDYNKDLIKHMLEADIVANYYYEGGAIANKLRYDKQMKRAVEILSSPEEYNRILHPKKK
ncbi:MAG: S41 family peptidase [Prevotella sp.]|nr:S41 family peptidase [Prevotella sp.]